MNRKLSNCDYLVCALSFYFPVSLKGLKERWCCITKWLTKIKISPSNDQFVYFIDDKFLFGIYNPNNNELDNILFARDINETSIPSNIKIISSYAFEHCINLEKVEFSPKSNLETIRLFAFYKSITNLYYSIHNIILKD